VTENLGNLNHKVTEILVKNNIDIISLNLNFTLLAAGVSSITDWHSTTTNVYASTHEAKKTPGIRLFAIQSANLCSLLK